MTMCEWCHKSADRANFKCPSHPFVPEGEDAAGAVRSMYGQLEELAESLNATVEEALAETVQFASRSEVEQATRLLFSTSDASALAELTGNRAMGQMFHAALGAMVEQMSASLKATVDDTGA